jgi:hypothetical protein
VTGATTTVVPAMSRYGHTATRLANGWVLIAGGRSNATNSLMNNAMVFKPELGQVVSGVPTGGFDPVPVQMNQARALHAATLLGSGQVLLTGGLALSPSSTEEFTTSSLLFQSPNCFTTTATGFSPVNPLATARAEHTATAVDCGSVFIIGGRNAVGSPSGLNFLDSVEFYAFSNSVPVVSSAMTATSGTAGTVGINFVVTDADADGGYVIIRYRTTVGSGNWEQATIASQTPSSISSPANFANHQVCPGPYTFVWNFAADGVSNATQVEIEILPFGAVIGTPTRFVARTP